MDQVKRISALLLALAFIISSCSEDEVDPGVAPELPPVASMEMEFSNFQEQGGRLENVTNWEAAAATVGLWNTIVAVGMIVPVASFSAAISQTPTYDSDRELWVWAYDHNVLGRTYSFELTGQVNSSDVEWNMYASLENDFQNALWFTGTMNLDGTSGVWTLNKDGNNPTQFLQIDWKKEGEEVSYLRYLNVEQGTSGAGAYIEYGFLNDPQYNRFYNIIGPDGNGVNIEWSEDNGNGRVKLGNAAFQCWDQNFENIDC